MSGDQRRYALDISENFFRLTTESLRLHSNETRRYQTLASLINARATAAPKLEEHNPETIRSHLDTIPTKGEIRIYLNISKTSATNLGDAKKHLASVLGSSMTLGDALSILLFDYIVEQKASRVLQRLGFDELSENCDKPNENDSQ